MTLAGMKLTVNSDFNSVGLGHPGSSRNKVGNLTVEIIIFVLLHNLQAQLTRNRVQTAGFSCDAGHYFHPWKAQNTRQR